jgi:GntR family transcriptional regulator
VPSTSGPGGELPTLRLPPSLGPGPKGRQLRDLLEHAARHAPAGTRVPGERELAERFDVARMTVRAAVDDLVADGLLHREHGRGTFVSHPRLAQPVSLTSFSEDMRLRGRRAAGRVLVQEPAPATPTVALALELAADAEVVHLDRLRSADGEPVAVERARLPAARFPGLETAELADGSLYATLAERYGCRVADSEQRVTAVAASAEDAALLGVAPGAPALRIERRTRDRSGRPIELVRAVYRGDRYELVTHQRRPHPTIGPDEARDETRHETRHEARHEGRAR